MNEKDPNSNSSASNQFAIIVVEKLARSLEEEVTALLFEAGAEGVSEDLPFVQKDLRYDPEVVMTEALTLKAYFTKLPSESVRLEIERAVSELERREGTAPRSNPSTGVGADAGFGDGGGGGGTARVFVQLEDHRDWLEEWKKGFVPFLFAEPFWIVPKWCEVPKVVADRPDHVILMDPGMAFGTGTHETTKLAAGMIVDWMSRRTSAHLKAGMRVLDVGTGTGVLALITERLGSERAVGLDIDPEARRTARENLELNRAQKTVIDDRDLADVAVAEPASYDLVIANIIDGVLLLLAGDLAATVKPGGTLVLSGILTDREDEFHREFAKLTGLEEQKRERMGEWCSSVWRKGGTQAEGV
jgi:ribosomal protein L11 methyltransferase